MAAGRDQTPNTNNASASAAFVPSAASLTMRGQDQSHSQNVTCNSCNRRVTVTRRSLLGKCALAATSFLLGTSWRAEDAKAEQSKTSTEDSGCKNCYGSGTVQCELCSGTGFWRAIAGNDPRQKYKGVVCPECEGAGILTCPVCLGTGEGNVKGLLRRRRIEPGPGRILQS